MMKPLQYSVLILLLLSGVAFPCTMIMVAKNGVILAGNNEDWKNPNTRMWFIPAGQGKYGRVCFGFDDLYPQGGMNDQGLFIDGNALAPTGWQPTPGKQLFQGNLMDHILAHCADVEEAIAFLKQYNFRAFSRAKFPIADARGEAMVVEYGRGEMQFIRRSGHYQISTNFVQSNFSPEEYPCHRYRTAEKMIQPAETVSVDLVRAVLSATHSEFFSPTVYSNICDLANKRVYLYNFHNFEEVVTIDLEKELKKGRKTHIIPSLFSIETQAARLFENFSPKPGAAELMKIILQKGVQQALSAYQRFKEDFRKIHRYRIDEREINSLGYMLLNDGRVTDAIEIFKLNASEHPASYNVYDSLAEAYMKNGQKDLAIQFYRKSLDLYPGNANAREKLNQLQE